MRSLRPKLAVKKVRYPLAKGQIWKTDREYLHILQLGKRLIEYRILKHVDQRQMKTQMSAIGEVERYLAANAAKLHNEVRRSEVGSTGCQHLKRIHRKEVRPTGKTGVRTGSIFTTKRGIWLDCPRISH